MKNILAVIGGFCVAKTIYRVGEMVGEVRAARREMREIRRERKEKCEKVWASA